MLSRNRVRCGIAGMLSVLVACAFMPVHAHAGNTFAEALAAARDHDWPRLEKLEQQLGSDHPLQDYLDFHRVVATLPDASATPVREFIDRYPDSPLAADIRGQAIQHWGRADQWSSIRALGGNVPSSTSLACYVHRAWLEERAEQTTREAMRLWLHGGSRPAACDPLFEAMRNRGDIGADQIWQRLLLAFRAGNSGMVRYLSGLMPDDSGQPVALLQHLYHQPGPGLDSQALTNLKQERTLLARTALHRLAGQDPVSALQWLRSPRARQLGLDDEKTRTEVERRIAWFMVIRDIKAYRPWLNEWLLREGDQALMEQRIRLAIREQDWRALPAWIARLPVSEQGGARWQYWLGRAWQEQNEQALAEQALARAAKQRSFYGFVAARARGQAYAFNRTPPPPVDPAVVRELAESRALQRISLLREIGEPGLARDEWYSLLYRAGLPQRQAMASLALDRDWPDLAVNAALHQQTWDVLDWRFPQAFRDSFRAAADSFQLDPWLAMAVARRESSFAPQARSPVGALGVMQLMPATARRMARALNKPAPEENGLLQPETSIRLGSAFLAQMLERYDGHRIKALAAYNAGPHRVDDWLPDRPVPFDVWIESIPFHETRDYVQAVLAYRLILAALHDENVEQLALLREPESGLVYPPDTGDDVTLSQR
jgi:soluble lytic murein transglycosylase